MGEKVSEGCTLRLESLAPLLATHLRECLGDKCSEGGLVADEGVVRRNR